MTVDEPDLPTPDLLRGLLQPRLSRRSVLQAGGLGALASALAACGVSTSGKNAAPTNSSQSASASKAAQGFWQQQKKTGQLDFANWPLYIDVNPKNKNDHPSIDLFTKQTSIHVKYDEVVNANDSFFGKIQPELSAGQGTGYDLMVVTNGIYLDKLKALGYLIPLDQKLMTNFYRYASPLVKNPSYDRGNRYTMAWQSGITGIGYDPKKVGHEITSWADLQDPKLKGKIGMFGDTEDMPNSALLAVGVKPETSTQADWKKAVAWLKKQQPLVRKYYDQNYIDPLSKGDIWASMAWSGDIYQANASGANLKFVVPKEGGVLWTDNMCIPKGAKHPLDAMTYMDFVYQPKIAAMLAEYINYITPVSAAQQAIKQDAQKAKGSNKADLERLATSQLIFPSRSDFGRLHRYRVLTTSELSVWNSLFEPIYQS
jgi:spermidine/putrescine transport system substrate-binding protein